MRQKQAKTKAMRAAGHKPSEESRYAQKRRRRIAYARAEGFDLSTPFPVMGVQDSRLLK